MPYRSHRVAPGGRPRGNLHRSATGDATACPDRASTAYNARAAVPRTKSAGLGQRGWSRVRDRSVRPADGAVPAEERVARKGNTRDDRVHPHGRARHAHRRVVCDRRRTERRGGRTGGPRCSIGQAETRAAVWPLEAETKMTSPA